MKNEEAIEQIKWYFEEDDGSGAEPITKEAVSLAISALERDRWISVEERLPEEAGEYITKTDATGKNNGVIAQRFVRTTVRGKPVERWEWYGKISPWTVTHWRPLPEPPKEET